MKKRIIILASVIIILAGALGFVARAGYVVPVLMYHSIDDKAGATKLSVSPESFARQMEFLNKNHYNVVGLDKVALYTAKKEKAPVKTVAVTFDDGFENNYTNAFPALKKYHIPATIFVIVDKIGKPGYLDWKELKEMSDSGVVTIGSHTISHGFLTSLDADGLVRELKDSREVLERGLGKKVEYLCYPMGRHSELVKRVAKEAGYSCAVTTGNCKDTPSHEDVFAVKRIKISRTSDNLLVFWIKTSGYYTWIKECTD